MSLAPATWVRHGRELRRLGHHRRRRPAHHRRRPRGREPTSAPAHDARVDPVGPALHRARGRRSGRSSGRCGDAPMPGQFYAGWLTEYSLSLDNLFVFVIIMSRFRVPAAAQQTVLLIGILLALFFRSIFIALGAAAISRYSWVFYFFGAFLVYTAGSSRATARTTTTTSRRTPSSGWSGGSSPPPRTTTASAAHDGGRGKGVHADADRHGGDRDHRRALRPGLDPGDLRAHRRSRTWSSRPTPSR